MSVQDLLNYIALQDEGFSRSVTEDIDGNVLERLEYLANRAGGAKKVSGSGYLVYPSAAGAATVSCPGTLWANGSYTQVVSATAQAIYVVGVLVVPVSDSAFEFEMDLAAGGAGSEVVIGTLAFQRRYNTNVGHSDGTVVMLPFPIAIATSTRIAARGRASVASMQWWVKLIYVNQSDLVAL